MSKKTKKQARKANILTLGVSDLSPIVGSIIADKDAIIIKKMPNGGASVFFSDQNGNVIGRERTPTQPSPKNPESPEQSNFDLQSLSIDDMLYIKNRLDALKPIHSIDFISNSEKYNDLKLIVYVNDKRLEYPTFSARIFVKIGDIIKIKSSDYPNVKLKSDDGQILGDSLDFVKEITELQTYISFSDVEDESPSLPNEPAPVSPPEKPPVRGSEDGLVFEKNIRVFFPVETRYMLHGEEKAGNGWTDIRIYANDHDNMPNLFIDGSQIKTNTFYFSPSKKEDWTYGRVPGGQIINVSINFSDIEEGEILNFEQSLF